MKARTAIIAALGCAALLCSCGPFGSRIAGLEKIKAAENEAASLSQRVRVFADLAAGMGFPKPESPNGFLNGSDEGLGFKIVTSKDGKAMDARVVWSAAGRDKLVEKSKSKGYAVSSAPVWHCRPYLDKASPLPSAARGWNDAKLAEWLAWEWAARKLKPKDDEGLEIAATGFFAYKAGQSLLIKSLGPGSNELARWQEGIWDKRTFQTLASDLKSQVEGIIKAQEDPKERETVLKRIVGFWIKDYRNNYPRRFITNAYLDFGKEGWIDPTALYCVEWDSKGWQDWEKAYPGPAEDLGVLLQALKK